MVVTTRGVLRRSPRLAQIQAILEEAAKNALRKPLRRRRRSQSSKRKKTLATTKTIPKSKSKKSVKVVLKKQIKKKKGIKAAPDTRAPLGVVDPASGLIGEIVEYGGEAADAMLVLVDRANNSDKYFVLQWIQAGSKFVVYSRWGRTGTSGQNDIKNFKTREEAQKVFAAKFKQKTGLTWANRKNPSKAGFYRFITQDFEEKRSGYANGKWQYFVNDGVDGKGEGWYDYTAEGSRGVEMLFHHNERNSDLTERHVTSGSFTYNVDLGNMTQTNISHPARTSRRIRRVAVPTSAVATKRPVATTPKRGKSPVVSPSPKKKRS